jgi:hypothetical protein
MVARPLSDGNCSIGIGTSALRGLTLSGLQTLMVLEGDSYRLREPEAIRALAQLGDRKPKALTPAERALTWATPGRRPRSPKSAPWCASARGVRSTVANADR